MTTLATEQLLAAIADYHASVYRVAYRTLHNAADAEDMAQEAFLRLWRSDPPPARAALRAWLVRVTLNLSINRIRAERSRRNRERTWSQARNAASEEKAMDTESLTAALENLPQELRLPISLHYHEGLHYREIATVLECPEGTVASRISRGRQELRQQLRLAGVAFVPTTLDASLQSSSPVAVPTQLANRIIGKLGVELPTTRASVRPSKVVAAVACAVLLGASLWWAAVSSHEDASPSRFDVAGNDTASNAPAPQSRHIGGRSTAADPRAPQPVAAEALQTGAGALQPVGGDAVPRDDLQGLQGLPKFPELSLRPIALHVDDDSSATIAGLVLTPEQTPIRDARVQVVGSSGATPKPNPVASCPKGSFHIASLGPGIHVVEVAAAGYCTRVVAIDTQDAETTITLLPAASLTVLVEGARGTAGDTFAEYTVELTTGDGRRHRRDCDHTGTARFTTLPVGLATARVLAGRRNVWHDHCSVAPGDSQKRIVLGRGARLDVILEAAGSQSEDTREASPLRLSAQRRSRPGAPPFPVLRGATFSTKENHFEFRGLLPGTYDLLVLRQWGFSFVVVATATFELPKPTATETGADLQGYSTVIDLAATQHRDMTCSVLTGTGEPVAGAWVRLETASGHAVINGRTDAAGGYTAPNVPDDTVSVDVHHPSTGWSTHAIPAGAAIVECRLPALEVQPHADTLFGADCALCFDTPVTLRTYLLALRNYTGDELQLSRALASHPRLDQWFEPGTSHLPLGLEALLRQFDLKLTRAPAFSGGFVLDVGGSR
ncbi:MAG: sigma-70 family RNA polymerase sigma factor [Planctomycetota bacterium]